MFLVMGISPGEKKLNFAQKIVCACCGRFGSYEAYMTYLCFNLFFIPIVKWDKRYFIKTACCHASCEIDRALGYQIAKGEITELDPNDLNFSRQGRAQKRCALCGFTTDQAFRFCPHCGNPLE
ncbi:MAG TPA: zinc ribbon domain-containing protein [Feifaniaceae bacterium]|nr:zinc ribbon domain-containing protein [Feifaniaceae bacterium]